MHKPIATRKAALARAAVKRQPKNVCVYVHVYVYVYVYVYVFVDMYLHVYVYAYLYVYVYVCIHVCACVRVCVCVCMFYMHKGCMYYMWYVNVRVYLGVHAHIYVCIHVQICTRTYAYYICICTCMLKARIQRVTPCILSSNQAQSASYLCLVNFTKWEFWYVVSSMMFLMYMQVVCIVTDNNM